MARLLPPSPSRNLGPINHPSLRLCFLPVINGAHGSSDQEGRTRRGRDSGSVRRPCPRRRPRRPLTLGLAVHAVGVPADVPDGLQGHRLALARQPRLHMQGDTQVRDVRAERETRPSPNDVGEKSNRSGAKTGPGRRRTPAPLPRASGKGMTAGE